MSAETGSEVTKIEERNEKINFPSSLKRTHSSDSESDNVTGIGNGENLFSKKGRSENLDEALRSKLDVINSSNDYYGINGDLIITPQYYGITKPRNDVDVAIWSEEEVKSFSERF
jgi:hypothetical protein